MANTPNINLNLPDYGSGGWNIQLNDNFIIIDEAIKEAIDRGYNIKVSPEAPLVPKYGMVWVDTSQGSDSQGIIKGKYKVYNGEVFEEYKYVTDADLVQLSPEALFVATDVEGALHELKTETDKIDILSTNVELNNEEITTLKNSAGKVGTKEVDETDLSDNFTLRYDEREDKLVYVKSEIDRIPPEPITSFTLASGNNKITLSWTNPIDEDFAGIKILRSETGYPKSITDGTVVYTGANTSYIDNTVVNYTKYYYRVFPYDLSENYNDTIEGQQGTSTPSALGYSHKVTLFEANAKDKQVVLTWKNPTDVDFNKVRIQRKLSDYPADMFDGLNVYDGAGETFTDTGLVNDTEYYYRIFPYSKENVFNNDTEGQQLVSIPKAYQVYGVKIDTLNSNPKTAVTYTDMAIGFTEAFCNNGNWQMGDWTNKFPFNVIKPCLLKDGMVNYYLNPNDYTKKESGEASDITSGADGDVMIEFPKIYWKFERVGTDLYIRYSDVQVDASYLCLAHTIGSTVKDKIYISAYRGHSLGGKLRSLSGKAPTGNQNIGQFRNLAQANGSGYQQMPYYSLLMLQVLALVAGKNRDSQTQLGRGYVDGNASAIGTGNTNTKGMFYGENTGKQQNKFCGVEDFYGNMYLFIDGMYSDASRNMMISDQTVFNDNGSGYENCGVGASANLGGWIGDVQGTTKTGFIIKSSNGSATTHYSDNGNLNGGSLPASGGFWNNGDNAGPFRLYVDLSASAAGADYGARLSHL